SRLHMVIGLLIVLVITIYGYVTFQKSLAEDQAGLNSEIAFSIKSIASDIEIDLSHLAFSMLFVVDQVRLHEPFKANGSKEILAQDFISFLNTSDLFDQLRLLDREGKETIRANYNAGSPVLVSGDKLQNKGDSYYFKKTIGLSKQEIYLSPLDLNVEHDRIEQPIKPTLRLAMPSFNKNGEKSGVMVINALAQGVIDHFNRRAKELSVSHLYWLNQDGYWLAGEDEDLLWGFMHPQKKNVTLAARDPQAWQSIKSQQHGAVRGEHGTYVFTTILPQQTVAGVKALHAIVDFEQWKVVAYYSDNEFQTIFAEKHAQQLLVLILTGVSLLLLFWMLVLYDNQRLRNQQSRDREREIAQQHERMESTAIIAGGIAHEFNNILAGMTANAYLLKKNHFENREETHLNSINSQINRAAKLIRYLLTFSRQGLVQLAQLNLSKLVVSECRQFRQEQSVDIELQIDVAPDISIEGDGEKIKSVIHELLVNAVEAMEGNESRFISVSLKQSSHEFTSTNGQNHDGLFACLSVCDSGSGIAAEVMPFIYDPFFSTKEVGKGTGLGLSAIYGTVKIHYGDIEVVSEPGEGACFNVSLPLKQPKEGGAES
ncbi:MAG TPA: ATP-binding protein, partial [Mariprofundaceae bacterium]|nr:ATP-binding protein [Mariprofundaceae bacterium]